MLSHISPEDKTFPVWAIKKHLQKFPQRTQDIVCARYDLNASGRDMTLDAIGKQYGVTRERIRQIVASVMRDMRNREAKLFQQSVDAVASVIECGHGIMEKSKLLQSFTIPQQQSDGAARFFIDCSNDRFLLFTFNGTTKDVVALKPFDKMALKDFLEKIHDLLKQHSQPVFIDELHKKAQTVDGVIEREKLAAYLAVSVQIQRNAFGQWGLRSWPNISPRGARDRAELILRHEDTPMHYRDIADKMDRYNMVVGKKVNPQTVHNELIKGENFVLLGKGVYALKSWGVKGGTVKEIITEILGNNEPLSRDDIITKVLKKKDVKPATIIISLNQNFKKNKDGKYELRK